MFRQIRLDVGWQQVFRKIDRDVEGRNKGQQHGAD